MKTEKSGRKVGRENVYSTMLRQIRGAADVFESMLFKITLGHANKFYWGEITIYVTLGQWRAPWRAPAFINSAGQRIRTWRFGPYEIRTLRQVGRPE